MEILSIVAGTVLESLVAPIGRELGYIFFYKKNIKDLEEQLRNLRDSRERVQSFVDVARSNAYEIYNDVLTWLAKVDSELLIPQQNDEGVSNRNNSNLSCLNLVQCQPRKTKKRAEYILQLIDDGKKFDKDNVGCPAPLPGTKCPTLPIDYQILESRTLMAEKIKDALADPNVNKVGVCGMGGVGKTKLLDEVKKLVLENNMFHRVIVVTIGTSKGVMEIQDEIGGMLNINLNANSKEVRASLLQTKLVEMKENILIMLDDLWKEYDLEKEIGIPCRSKSSAKGCKILMTGRSHSVFTNQMNTEKLFEVNPLSDEEAWKFFIAIVGECVHQGDVEHIARDVVKECGGLPIALKVLAKALKMKKLQVWKDALKKLKNHVLVGIRGVNDELYTCLKISYDSIEDEAQLLFLLCSVFPDDHKIWVKDLQIYAMGMRLLNNINNWEDVKNRVTKLVDDLKSSYLLLEANEGGDYVQMHDVVRDVAKYIASKIEKMSSLTYGCGQSDWREEDRCGSYNAIFVDCMDLPNLPPKLEFPNLQLLILRFQTRKRDAIQILDAFFEGMENLSVLDMKNMHFRPSRTLLTSYSIKNLQTLCMTFCECNNIDTIGELKKLKILRINSCWIQELPKTMSQLTELKVLEVSDCFNLEVVHPNIISSMTKLEELNLWGFRRWGEEVPYKKKLIKNVELLELNCLRRLSNLRLEVSNVDIFSNELSSEIAWKLEEFCICVADSLERFTRYNCSKEDISDGYATTLVLDIKSKIASIGGAVEILLQRCEKLHVEDSVGFTKLLLKPNGNYGYPRLKHLSIYIDNENSDMPCEIGNITPFFDVQVSFVKLKDLTIEGGNNLKMFWHNNRLTANSFCKLQNIYIRHCNKLTYVFLKHMVTSLVFLNTLEISYCELLERIFEIEEPTHDVKAVSLAILNLNYLPNLKCVWNKNPGELLAFPNLKRVQVGNCPQLKSLFPCQIGNSDMPRPIGNITPFFDVEVSLSELEDLRIHEGNNLETLWHNNGVTANSFCKLQNIYIEFCNKLTNLFPSHMVASLVFLKTLEVANCELVERIFEIEEQIDDVKVVPLTKLKLRNLSNLKYVWNNDPGEFLPFPNLKEVNVYACPQLKSLFPASFMKRMEEIESLCADEENEIFAEDEASKLVLPETVLFPSLRILIIHCKVVEKRRFWVRSESFPKLDYLQLTGSKDDGMATLSLEMIEIIYKSTEFVIVNAFELVQVFQNGEENNKHHSIQSRAKLKRLSLRNLPKLTHVWEDNTKMTTSFDCLEAIDVHRCENLKCLLPLSITFFNLTSLQVGGCHGMMNLFRSSVAKNLVNIQEIEIWHCRGMSSIVVAEEKDEEIIFNRMKRLVMSNLPRLASFHPGKCTLMFPCLEMLRIKQCPEMKTFSYGIISTPRLHKMSTDKDDIPVSPAHGVNLVVQHFFEDEIVTSIKHLFTQQGEEYSVEDSEE